MVGIRWDRVSGGAPGSLVGSSAVDRTEGMNLMPHTPLSLFTPGSWAEDSRIAHVLRKETVGGGLLLLWIGFKLLKQEEESQEGFKVAANMGEAIATILIADFVMSMDNVLGVAGASHGSVELLIFGLILSMGILMFMGNIVANLVNKLWWLSYIGSGVIAWTGGLMIFDDKLIHNRVGWMEGVGTYISAAAITLLTLGLAHWYHRVRAAQN